MKRVGQSLSMDPAVNPMFATSRAQNLLTPHPSVSSGEFLVAPSAQTLHLTFFEILTGYGVAVGCAVAISFIVGAITNFWVNDKAENYFVAGHSLPLWIVAVTLGAASVDSNALLGNADLSYSLSFYDGACKFKTVHR